MAWAVPGRWDSRAMGSSPPTPLLALPPHCPVMRSAHEPPRYLRPLLGIWLLTLRAAHGWRITYATSDGDDALGEILLRALVCRAARRQRWCCPRGCDMSADPITSLAGIGNLAFAVLHIAPWRSCVAEARGIMASWSSKRFDDGNGKENAHAGNANVRPRFECLLVLGRNEDMDNCSRADDYSQATSNKFRHRQSAQSGDSGPLWPTRPQHGEREGGDKNRAKDKTCNLDVRDTPVAGPRASASQGLERKSFDRSRCCIGVQMSATIALEDKSAKLQRASPSIVRARHGRPIPPSVAAVL
jgi:hypothetical protein